MQTISAEEKALWRSDIQKKNLRIIVYHPQTKAQVLTLNNSDIVSESFELTQILESKNTLTFGNANAACVKFKCRDIERDIRNYLVRVTIALDGTNYAARTLFYGRIETQENQTHEDVLTSFIAYDLMRDIYALNLTSWWNSYSPANNSTLQTYVSAITNKIRDSIGCSVSIGSCANLSLSLESKPDLSKYQVVSGEMLIKWLAQICNVYFYFDDSTLKTLSLRSMAEGLFPATTLYPNTTLFPDGGTYDVKMQNDSYNKLSYEPYKTAIIDKVVVTDQESIEQGQYPAITGNNILYIESNPFVWKMNMQQAAQNIYDRVKNVWFTPCVVNCPGMPYMEMGDMIKIQTAKNEIFAYILKRTLKGIQILKDTFRNESDQYQESHAQTFASITSDNGKSVLKIQADIVEMNEVVAQKATITDLNATNIRVGSLEADHVTTAELTATNGRIGALEADHVTTEQLNATNGRVGTLETNSLTADNINSKTFTLDSGHIGNLDASKITSGTISAARIDTNFASAQHFTVPYTGFKMGDYEVSIARIVDRDGNVWNALCAYFE